MADFEKVPTGHERWPAQWPAVRVRAHAFALAGSPTSAKANRALAWAWPVVFDGGPYQTLLCS